MAGVVPIFRKGERDDPGNYKSDSLTSVACKVLESIIRDKFMEHLLDEGFLADVQHDFRWAVPGSRTTQLLRNVEEGRRDIRLTSFT